MFLFFLLLLSTIKLNSFLRIIVIISYIFVISFMYWNISFIFISVVMIKDQLFYESNCTRSLEINAISTLALSFGLITNWFWIKFKEFNGLLCRSTLLWNFEDVFLDKVFIFSSILSITLPFHSMSTDLFMPCLLHNVSIQSLSSFIRVDLAFLRKYYCLCIFIDIHCLNII